jgi:hypothetical protein
MGVARCESEKIVMAGYASSRKQRKIEGDNALFILVSTSPNAPNALRTPNHLAKSIIHIGMGEKTETNKRRPSPWAALTLLRVQRFLLCLHLSNKLSCRFNRRRVQQLRSDPF